MVHSPSIRPRSRSDDDGTQLVLIGIAAVIGLALMLSAVLLPGS